MENRKTIQRQNHFTLDECDGKTIQEVIQYFEKMQAEMAEAGESDFTLYYYKSYEGEVDCYFTGNSEETDHEYNTRIAQEEYNKNFYERFLKEKEEKDLAEYERLKAKYEQ